MKKQIFVINTKNLHYVVGIDNNGLAHHIHWGKKCKIDEYEIPDIHEVNSNHTALDMAKTEYIPFGGSMYRNSAFKCEYFDKCRDTVLTFDSVKQDENNLEITLADKEYSLLVTLCYKFSADNDIITRYVKITNNSDKNIKLDKILSGEITLPGENCYNITNCNGSWGGEFALKTTKLETGTLVFDSKKGNTGHTNSPFVVMSQNATEDFGDVYYAALGYSGNFKIEVQRDFVGITRAIIGINDFDFSYTLHSGETFVTPKLYIGKANGFAQMSNDMNDFAVNNILPKSFAKKPLPVLYNSWEAIGFDVNCEQQLKLAEIAKNIGCELFVMDDGWFGQRKNDWAGLGDWYVNKEKFPDGLKPLIDGVNQLGIDFGLWFEPEMVNPDSDLYRTHPEWTYYYKTRKPSELRHQLVLNITKEEVAQFVFDSMDKMLDEYNIRYIKWDMNRPFSEIGADNLENQQELWYRHTMAIYDIADRLKAKHPYLQIEACASGGGRAEYGAMEHFDMVWTSDNTDPVDRLAIQQGFSMVYPRKCMRSWVTDWSNNKRPVNLDFRFNVSMQGSLSVGSNLLRYSDEDLEKSKKYIELYKNIRTIVQFGKLYRLKNYENDEFFANQYVDDNKENCVLFTDASTNAMFNLRFKSIKLKGLEENTNYTVKTDNNEFTKSGSYLMNVGFPIDMGDPLKSNIYLISKNC